MLDKNATIMVVDDMRMVRNIVKRYLTSLGYENVVEAENGSVAFNKFQESVNNNNKIALIFMDIVMPIMDGKETLKKIREIDSTVPIMMLSSISDEDVIKECEQVGIEGYILKPIDPDMGPKIFARIVKDV